MSFLRRFLVAALALGGLLAAPSAAFASTGQYSIGHQAAVTVGAVTTAPDTVRKVPCTGLTFNVYHGHLPTPTCFTGAGTKTSHFQAVRKITTGKYWGCLVALRGKTILLRSFYPEELLFFQPSVELVSFELAPYQTVCPP